MDYKDATVSLALKARCTLHKLVYQYLTGEKLKDLEEKVRKKVRDASRKFFVEVLEGNKSLRLKKKPHLKVHFDYLKACLNIICSFVF